MHEYCAKVFTLINYHLHLIRFLILRTRLLSLFKEKRTTPFCHRSLLRFKNISTIVLHFFALHQQSQIQMFGPRYSGAPAFAWSFQVNTVRSQPAGPVVVQNLGGVNNTTVPPRSDIVQNGLSNLLRQF